MDPLQEARQRGVADQQARARARIAQMHIDANNRNIQAPQQPVRQNENVQYFFGRARRSSRRPRRSSASFGKKRRSKRRSASFGKRRRSGAKPKKTTRRRSASFGKRRRSGTKRKTSRR